MTLCQQYDRKINITIKDPNIKIKTNPKRRVKMKKSIYLLVLISFIILISSQFFHANAVTRMLIFGQLKEEPQLAFPDDMVDGFCSAGNIIFKTH